MSSVIGRFGLEVGQWVQFSSSKDLSGSKPELREIYQDKQGYLVISREDWLFDRCSCHVVDIEGKRHDYSARMFSLGLTGLDWNGKIEVVSRESVEEIYGVKKVQAVYQAAEEHLRALEEYFASYPAQTLGKANSHGIV